MNVGNEQSSEQSTSSQDNEVVAAVEADNLITESPTDYVSTSSKRKMIRSLVPSSNFKTFIFIAILCAQD